jgi:CubicO group peptidase (beta-lactamase class C family)
MKKFSFLLLFTVFLCVNSFGQKNAAKEIDDFVKPFAEKKYFAGVILAAKDGKIVYEKAFGLANADYKIPNQLNTRIGIASITKLMTVVILNRLVESGKISPADKLSKYIPDFPNGDKITIEMLARHRSGIPHRVMPPEAESLSYTSAEFVEKVKQAKLAFEPGAQRLYSSGGYAVLARCLEIASGKSYAELLREYVFTPAGMTDSLDFDGETIMERRAQDYFLSPNGLINAALKDYSFLVGAGSVFSTARDVYKFGNAVLDGKFGETSKNSLIGENNLNGSGSTNGHRAYFEIEKNKKYGYVLLSNVGSGAFDLISQGIGEILQDKRLTVKNVPNPKFISLSNDELKGFLGKYRRSDGNGEVEVRLRNGALFAGDIQLYPTGKACFFEYRFFGEACFIREETGKIKEIKWKGQNFDLTWIKQ